MARIQTTTHIEAPVERVWDVLTAWEGQPRWMRDARSVAAAKAPSNSAVAEADLHV